MGCKWQRSALPVLMGSYAPPLSGKPLAGTPKSIPLGFSPAAIFACIRTNFGLGAVNYM
jgi:hypothetical protein